LCPQCLGCQGGWACTAPSAYCCPSYVQVRTVCPWLELRPLLGASTNTSANPGMKVGGAGPRVGPELVHARCNAHPPLLT
jgi:hypothetical protein